MLRRLTTFLSRFHIANLELKIEQYLKERRRHRLLRRYGGIQTCPWCKHIAQEGDARWGYQAWSGNRMFDVLTCSVCSGQSIVHFGGFGMMVIGPLTHPIIEKIEPMRTLTLATFPDGDPLVGVLETVMADGVPCHPTSWAERCALFRKTLREKGGHIVLSERP